MQKKYSWYSLLKAGLGNQEWDQAIPLSKPKSSMMLLLLAAVDMALQQPIIWLRSAALQMLRFLKKVILVVGILAEIQLLFVQTI